MAKQQAKRQQSRPVCLHAVEKYKKLKNINMQNDYETMSKKWTDNEKTNMFFVFYKCV